MPIHTEKHINISDDFWSERFYERVAKVILKGVGAYSLPPDAFLNALQEHGIIQKENANQVQVTIHASKRKRFVYGKVTFKHKQSFDMQYQGHTISFLFIDPSDTRSEVTLLHMPIDTTERAIREIFRVLNPEWHVSDIRQDPGKERRHYRWLLMLQCTDTSDIPHNFILPRKGPEGEHLRIKVFVTGRLSPCYHSPPRAAPPDC